MEKKEQLLVTDIYCKCGLPKGKVDSIKLK